MQASISSSIAMRKTLRPLHLCTQNIRAVTKTSIMKAIRFLVLATEWAFSATNLNTESLHGNINIISYTQFTIEISGVILLQLNC